MSRPARTLARILGGAVAVAAGLALALGPTANAATGAGGPASTAGVTAVAAAATPSDRVARAQRTLGRLDTADVRLLPRELVEWGLDDTGATLVVRVSGATVPAALTGLVGDPAVVRFDLGATPAQPLAGTGVVGGQAIYGGGKRCSVGFSVRQGSTPGVLTAGHCTKPTPTWNGVDRTNLGTVAKAAYPDDDYGMITVATPANWTMTNRVEGGPAVTGARVAAVGAEVCRSGSTSGYRCGKILARNVSVNYGNGVVVKGMTKTSACAEGGDSGGAVIEPATRQAQGLTSGGSGTCANGGVSYFQPLAEVLSTLRLTLVTA